MSGLVALLLVVVDVVEKIDRSLVAAETHEGSGEAASWAARCKAEKADGAHAVGDLVVKAGDADFDVAGAVAAGAGAVAADANDSLPVAVDEAKAGAPTTLVMVEGKPAAGVELDQGAGVGTTGVGRGSGAR